MSSARGVQRAIARAEQILPGVPAPDGRRDPRWQAIIRVAKFIETQPDAVWAFIRRWGTHPQEDLRVAISLCLFEHLLEVHFDLILPRIEKDARKSKRLAEMFSRCAGYVRRQMPQHIRRINRVERALTLAHARRQSATRR